MAGGPGPSGGGADQVDPLGGADAGVRRGATSASPKAPPDAGWKVHRSAPEPAAGAAEGCGRCLTLLVAVPATLVCVAMWQVGQRNHWSSDGPGMLFIMILFAGSGLAALAGWGAFLSSLTGWRFGLDDD